MATELAAAYVTIIPSLKGAGKTIEKALGGIDTTSTGKSWGKSLAGGMVTTAAIGVKALGAVGAAVGGLAVGGGISRALKLDEAEFKFKSMGIDVTKAMESCNEAVTGTAFGLDAAASVAAQLGTSGVQAGDQMTEALKGAAGMAAMGGVELERVGQVYAKVAAQGKLQGDELMQFSEMGVNALGALADYFGVTQAKAREMVKNGEVDFAEFSAAMNKMYGDAAKGANETFSGAMSNVGAALSRVGAKFASPALDGLRRVFVALIPAIDAVSKLLDPLVTKFTAFVDNVVERSVSGIEAFTKALGDTGSVMSAFKAMLAATFEGTALGSFISKVNGFFGAVRAGTSPVALLKAYWQDFVNSIGNSGILDTIREKIASLPQPVQNVISALSSFGEKVKGVFDNINIGGAAVAGVFALLAVKLAPVGAALAAFGTKAAGVFKILSGAPTIMAGLTQVFAKLSPLFTKLHIAFTGAGGGLLGIKAALAALITPAGIIVAAIAALGAAFAYLMTTNEAFRLNIMSLVANIGASLYPIIQIVGQALSNLASTVLPLITNAIMLAVPVLGQIITIIMQLVAAIAPVITAIVGTVIPIITSIIQLVVTLAAQIIAVVIPVVAQILGVIQMAMPLIQAIIQTVCGVVLGIVNMVWPMVQQIITTAANAVLDIIQTVMPIVRTIFGTVLPAILALVYAVWPVIQKVIMAVMDVIQGIIETAWPVIQNIIETVMWAVQGVINAVWPVIQGIIEAAMSVIQGVIGAVMAVIQGDWEGAWNIIKTALSNAWESIKSGVSSGIEKVMSLVSELPGKITDIFSDCGSWLLDAGKKILQGLWDGISGAMDWFGDKLSGIGSFIQEHKGPPEYDARLLTPNGALIMESLTKGITGGIPALEKTLAGVTEDIQGFGSDIAPFDDVNANVRTWRNVEFADDTSNMEEVISLLSSYLPEMAKEKQLVMDTGVVAGVLTPAIDKNLGIRNTRRSKGL